MPNIVNAIKSVVSGYFDSKVDNTQLNNSVPITEGNIDQEFFREQIISNVKQDFEKRQQDRLPYELRWRLTQNFIQGNQYCDINMITNDLYQVPKPFYWTQREVFNHLAAIVETRLSKLGRLKPSMTVIPATSETDDVTSAKVCKSILDSTYSDMEMSKMISEANSWMEITGTVFYKSVWDTQAGRLLGYVQCQEENCDCDMQPVYEGNVKTVIVNSFEIFPDSCFNDGVDKCRSIIHAKAFSIDEIKEIWNVDVAGKDIDVYSLGMSKVGCGGLGYLATVPTMVQTTKENSEIVIEKYEMPSRLYPEGRLIIVAGDKLLYYGTCPYKVGKDGKIALPFVRQECVHEPGNFFGISVAERCIPIQRAYNAVKNRKHEYLNRMVIGVLTYEENSIEDTETLEEDGIAPGTMIPRKAGSAPPSFINSSNVPPALMDEEEKLMNEFREISGVSELSSSSQVPTGTGSGVALEVLKEQDDTRISLTADNIRKAIIQVAKQWLRLYKQFATVPRMTRLVGKDNAVYLNYWSNNDITSDDVQPLTDDDLAQTPAQKKQQVMAMLQQGLFNDPDTGRMDRTTRAKVFDMLNFGNWEEADDIDQLHINRAMRENIDVQQEVDIRVRDFDDHVIHIEEHNKFRLSSDYTDLEKDRPDLAKYFDAHVEVHQQAIAFMEQKQMMMQQQAATPQQQPQENKSGGNAKITNTNIKGPRDAVNNQRG